MKSQSLCTCIIPKDVIWQHCKESLVYSPLPLINTYAEVSWPFSTRKVKDHRVGHALIIMRPFTIEVDDYTCLVPVYQFKMPFS